MGFPYFIVWHEEIPSRSHSRNHSIGQHQQTVMDHFISIRTIVSIYFLTDGEQIQKQPNDNAMEESD